MKIIYKPKFHNTGKNYYTIFVILDATEKENHNAFYLHSKKIVSDLKKASKRLGAILENTHATHFIIHLSNSIVDLKETTMIQHILWKFLSKFLPWKHTPESIITVTHDNAKSQALIANFVNLAMKIRDARLLAMTPANMAYPEILVSHFKRVFGEIPRAHVSAINYDGLKKAGFNLILAVGESAVHKPELLVVERPATKSGSGKGVKTVCIIGKGITFDTGGLSIKGFKDMIDMKFDKTGAVYGGYALAHLMEQSEYDNVHFVGIFPYAENAVSGRAVHPGDVVKSYLGPTVEITDPDAEGRLVLADAFGYAHKFHPNLIIDIATLTGHAESINCWHSGYYYAVPEAMKVAVEKLSYAIGEPMLPMPTWNDHDDVLESEVADFANSPRDCEDAYVATLFMKQFIPNGADWLHIDLSHEFDKHVPRGSGIRTIIETTEWWIATHASNANANAKK